MSTKRQQQATTGKLTAAQLLPLLDQAREALQSAEGEVDRAQTALDSQMFSLLAIDDQTGVQRLKKALRDAKEHRDEIREDVARAERQLATVTALEAHANEQAKWKTVRDECAELQRDAEQLQVEAEAFARRTAAHQERWRKLFEMMPVRPYSHDHVKWHRHVFARDIEMQIFCHSGGLLCVGRAIDNVYVTSKAPNYAARVREAIECVLSAEPSNLRPEPPKDAA